MQTGWNRDNGDFVSLPPGTYALVFTNSAGESTDQYGITLKD